jgi:nicotinamidase-related amidase
MSWREDAETLPNLGPAEFVVTLGSVALVIIDMQYFDAHRDYGLGADLKESHPEVWEYYAGRLEEFATPNSVRLLEAFREAGQLVVHVTYGPQLADGSDIGLALRNRPAVKGKVYPVGSFEHKFLPGLEPREGELVVNKTTRSAFNSTGIEALLRNVGIETLVVVGVCTSSCVENTVRDAADLGFQVVVVDDATAELDEESHNATLRQVAIRLGRVWMTHDVIEELGRLQSTSTLARE